MKERKEHRMRDDQDDEDERFFRQGQWTAAPKPPGKKSTKPRRGREPFVKVPLWWAEAAAKATRNQGFLVCVDLLHRAWKAKGAPFSMPNGRLAKSATGRRTKCRVLRNLEEAGLITVEWRRGKNPRVALVLL
jgi:hypothetical protein